MKHTIIYLGLDVDDTQYHGSAFDKNTGEVIDFKCRPTLKGLRVQLDKMTKHFPRCVIKVCYQGLLRRILCELLFTIRPDRVRNSL